jgi:hypothetical protein
MVVVVVCAIDRVPTGGHVQVAVPSVWRARVTDTLLLWSLLLLLLLPLLLLLLLLLPLLLLLLLLLLPLNHHS